MSCLVLIYNNSRCTLSHGFKSLIIPKIVTRNCESLSLDDSQIHREVKFNIVNGFVSWIAPPERIRRHD